MANLPTRGIDISEFNGDVNLAGIRDQIDFVIIRCGYGSDFTNQDDSQFFNNVRKCQALGIPFGVYLYSYAQNQDMALSEARHTLRLLQGLKPLYGVWYDVEDATLPTGDVLVENCITYCNAMEQAGFYCGIYSFLNWLETRLNSPRLDAYDKWLAQWASSPDYQKPFGIWQYSDNGSLGNMRFDMNYAYKDYPAIIGGQEDTDMTKEEVAALARQEAQKVYNENETKYKTMDTLPTWAKADVQRVYKELKLGGVSPDGTLDASNTYLRTLVVISRVLDLIDQLQKQPPNPPA